MQVPKAPHLLPHLPSAVVLGRHLLVAVGGGRAEGAQVLTFSRSHTTHSTWSFTISGGRGRSCILLLEGGREPQNTK